MPQLVYFRHLPSNSLPSIIQTILGRLYYLFVFGELIDAYQNRTLAHQERVKLVLRARYFMDYWLSYLRHTGYSEKQYLLSHEATDIIRYLIDGLIGLVLVYRDHIKGIFPLLPWLHSSETCKHIFGEARQIVKDFYYVGLLLHDDQLRVKLPRSRFSVDKSFDLKARATGYCHTIFRHQKASIPFYFLLFPRMMTSRRPHRQAMEECEKSPGVV